MKRQARLFALAEYLRGRRTGVTAEALAERFSVAVRTIYRDLESLRDAALPLAAERGPGGGFALDKSYTLPPVNFTPREAALLATVGRWATEMRLVPFPRTLAGALDKVRGALSLAAQRELQAHMARLQFVGVPAPLIPREVRNAVEEAWFEQRLLRIGYRRADGVLTDRVVRIAGALMERGQTLLLTEDVEKGEERQLRLDRISKARRRSNNPDIRLSIPVGNLRGVAEVQPDAKEMIMKNAVHWFVIPTQDLERGARFYEAMLGRKLHREVFGGQPIVVFRTDGPDGVGGALRADSGRRPSGEGSLVYLDAGPDIDACLARVAKAGGEVVTPKTDIGPPGFVAVVRDTEGNLVGLHVEHPR